MGQLLSSCGDNPKPTIKQTDKNTMAKIKYCCLFRNPSESIERAIKSYQSVFQFDLSKGEGVAERNVGEILVR